MNIKTNRHFKHILHTVLLLVMMGWSLSAFAEDEVIFSLNNKIGKAEKTADNATVTEGTSLVLSDTKGRIKLTPKAGAKFKNGDKISFSGTIGNTSKNYGIKIFGPDGTTNVGTPFVAGTTTPLTVEGVLTLSGDADCIYIARYDGTTTTLTSCEITRENPTINISSTPATNLATNTTYYIDAQGNYTTEQPASYVATYSCTGNKDHGNLGTVITIPNATEGRYTVELGGCQYNNGEYTIKSNNGAFEDITIPESETKTAACNDKITRSFLVTKPTTITIKGGSSTYLPFFSVVQKVGFAVSIVYDPEGSGTVDVDGSLFKNGEEVTMTATPNHGYEFKEWQDANGTVINGLEGNPNKYTFTMGSEDVTYKAVFTALSLYNLTTSVEPSEGGKITNKDTYPSHPEGEKITLTAVPNTGWSFSHWRKGESSVSEEITYSFSMPAEALSLTAVFKKQYGITFTKGDSGAEGLFPPVIYVAADNKSSFIVPANTSLYKKGYTLTGWTDGVNTYGIGQEVMVTTDMTLTPVFTANTVTLSDLTEETTVTWQFGRAKGALSMNIGSNATTYLVTQIEVNGSSIDLPLYVETKTGKLANSSRTDDFAQVNSGSEYTIYAFKNAKVELGSYSKNAVSDTKVGNTLVTGPAGSTRPYIYSSTVTETDITDGKVKIIIGKDMDSYMSGVSVTYPAQKKPSDLKVAIDKENITLNKGGETYTLTADVDYYTSSTGAMTFTSSIPEVASVDANGVITPLEYGKTIITVRQASDDTYASASISYTVKVISAAGQTEKPEVTIGDGGTVTITAVKNAKIYYTTDGTTPSESSTLYSGPFSAQGLVVKVAAYLDGKSPSDIVTAYVNVEGTFKWNWNTTGVLQTTPIIEGNVADIIDENTKVVIGKKLTQGASTQNGISTVTVGPTDGIAVTEVDEESTISFNIIPAAGIAFKPSAVSFKALRISTGSGFMDVHLKNENKDYTLLTKALPNLDALSSYNNESFKTNTDISTIPAAAEEWSLKYYIYTLTKGKTWGFSNIVISGTFTGVEYDGVFYKISATAEPAEGGTVTHAPAAGKAQPGKKVTFHASPNKGYRFVEWRDFEGVEDARTTAVFSVESLNKDLSYEAYFEKLPLITFVNNQTEILLGTVPKAAYTNASHEFTIPENTTLYYEGYALTAWTDGTNTYTVGGTYTFSEDVTLKPVLTKSDKAITDTDNALVATWYFDQKDGAPILSWNGNDVVFNYTESVYVGDTKIDLKMKMTGAKADNDDARVNFVTDGDGHEARGGQLNNGMTLTIPAVYGMTVKMQASLKKDYGNDGKSTPNETWFQNVPNGGRAATVSFTDGGTTAATGEKITEDRVLTFVYKGDATTLKLTVDNAGSVGTYGYFQYLEVTYPVLPDVKTTNLITSTPLLTEWEKAENAGTTDKTKPNANGNTGNRYKPGAQVTITANAGYGYYITAFKDGTETLTMTKVHPSADSDKPTTATASYTVKATTGTITVEYARLPMAKVRLETVDKTLGTVDFGSEDIHENFYEKGDGYVQSWFVANTTVTGSSDAADDYVLEKWMKADDNTLAGTGPTLSITVPAENSSVTYHTYFTLGKPGNIVFDIANAKLLKNGTLSTFSVDEKSTKPENQTNCRSFFIPRYHGLFKSYNAENNEKGYTLKYWVEKDETSSKYEIGKNYSFATENETIKTITLIPVFEENAGGMQNRINDPVITYEFGIGPGIRAQRLNLPKNTDTYLCAPVDVSIWENSQEKGHTRDVALWVNTGEKGFVRNTDFQEWAAIGPGTTLTIASCAGTKIEILSYAPISTTTIDGVVPTEFEKIGEHEYVYRYTTQNPAARIPIVIGDDYSYYKWIKAYTLAANRVQLHAKVENNDQGSITKTEAVHEVVEGDKKVYIEKMDDGGYSLIQGTRTKISFERMFGYTLDKIVDPDKIVNGKPLAVLEMLDNGNVKMVKPDDATVTEEVSQNADGSWGTKETVFLLRQSEPTAEEKAAGKRTKYEVEFEITKHRNLLFYFKEKKTYYITFNAGKQATGIAPPAIWVEANDEYTIPQNNTLYYSGYTLKRWEDEAGTIYNIGSKHNAPAADLRLYPVFELNTFSLLDNDLPPEATATWYFARKLGAPDINYERSSGILVTQLHKSDTEFIDLRLDLNASDRKDENGNAIKGKFNNLADQERCQINMHSIMTFPVTKGCEMELEANSAMSTTSICGATAENGGYEAGNKVRYTWNGSEGIQQVYFQNDGRYYTYFSIKYKPQTIEKPALESVSYAGITLSVEQLNTLKANKEITLETCPITLDPETGKLQSEKMEELAATATGTGKVSVTQPTIDNPTGYIRLLSGGESLLETYAVHFTLKAPTSTVPGAETTPKFLYTEINGEKFYSHEVSVVNMPASGYIKVVFDRTMKAKDLTFTVGDQIMTFSAKQGKELTFYYWNLPNVTLNYTIPGTDFVDIYGQPHTGGDFIKHFKTRGTTKEIVHKTFDFIVGEDGSLDDAINAANADKGTDRYLIFIPDGEYQLTGNESLEGRYNITSDGAWPCDGDGNAVTDEEMKTKYNYENGMTQVTRPKVSIIGQSREGVMVWNKPIVEGIGYTATIHVGGSIRYDANGNYLGYTRAEDFYAEDFSMENRFPYWSSMGGGSGAGRAVVLWDQGQRTTLKNVSMMSWQDTYYSSNANDDYRGYFENCQLGGVVDWVCGDGNIWFEKCDIIIRDRSGNNIAAPSQEVTQQWGYVFKDCNVKPELPLDQTERLKDKTWTLARPWASSTEKSPAITYINTKMYVLPRDQGWGVMTGNSVLRFHENHSMDGDGTVLSLGSRTLAAALPAAGSDDCVMNDADAAKYTIQNVLGGTDSYTPKERTIQIDAASGDAGSYDAINSVVWNDNIEIDDDRLKWDGYENALCYFIFKKENEKWVYKRNVTETSISLDQINLGAGTYCVRAANQYGGLGAPTMPIKYEGTRQYVLHLKEVGDTPGYGWSTICLSANTKAPEGVNVYAATAHDKLVENENVVDYLMSLTPVSILNKDMGYVVYGPVGDYTFKATSKVGSEPTILRGNSSDHAIPATNISCYVLADKTWGIGFYKFNGTELKAKRAWLPADKVSTDVQQGLSTGVKAIRFTFPEGTGIEDIIYNIDYTNSDAIYDLSGQQLPDIPNSGVYIQKGKGKIFKKR